MMCDDPLHHALDLYLGAPSAESVEWLVRAFRRAVRNGAGVEASLELPKGWRSSIRRRCAHIHISRAASALVGASPWTIACALDSKLRALRSGAAPRDAVDAELAAARLIAPDDLPVTPEGLYYLVLRVQSRRGQSDD